MKNKLLFAVFVILNLVALYLLVNFYSADYLLTNHQGARLEETIKPGVIFIIFLIVINVALTGTLLFASRRVQQ